MIQVKKKVVIKNKYIYVDNVMNNYKSNASNDFDNDLGININKSNVNRYTIKEDLNMCLYIIKHQINKVYFEQSLKRKYIREIEKYCKEIKKDKSDLLKQNEYVTTLENILSNLYNKFYSQKEINE